VSIALYIIRLVDRIDSTEEKGEEKKGKERIDWPDRSTRSMVPGKS
jgi:hypothetical protein